MRVALAAVVAGVPIRVAVVVVAVTFANVTRDTPKESHVVVGHNLVAVLSFGSW